MTISPARVAEIRTLMDSEFRTHDQLDAVVEELLADAERTPTDPTADHLRAIADLRAALQSAVTLIRTTSGRFVVTDPERSDLLDAAADDMVEVLARTAP